MVNLFLVIAQVWGCGSDTTLQAQKNQQEWESKAVERERGRKVIFTRNSY